MRATHEQAEARRARMLSLMKDGTPHKEIAERLGVSLATVQMDGHILRKRGLIRPRKAQPSSPAIQARRRAVGIVRDSDPTLRPREIAARLGLPAEIVRDDLRWLRESTRGAPKEADTTARPMAALLDRIRRKV